MVGTCQEFTLFTVFVCVGLTISALNIGFGRFSTWGEGAQATASEASRPTHLREAFTRVQGAGSLAGVARGQHSLA